LGATPGRAVRAALAQGAALAGIGLGLGLAASYMAAGYLRPWLFATAPADPLVIAAAGVGLGGAALMASWVPARRAGTVDPLTVLRDS
jgi:ABC-type lipoprotein release transport system permease subunit